MCGIAGEIVVDPAGRVALDAVPAMASLLAHRGPDQWGYVVDDRRQVLLVNTRLAIVDVAGGRQPLCNEDGSIWITLNGEFYGFERQGAWLRSRGHFLRTRSDAEVIVHLYEELGERFVDRLRGEFAFVLHDRRRGVCYLVRDRFGVKPLVYAEPPGSIVFGSEAKALFAHPRVRPSLDREQILHMFGGVFIPGRTFFSGVKQVEPGTWLRVESGTGVTRPVRYWTLPLHGAADAPATHPADAVDAFHDKLLDATRVRLHGDVEVGVYLSGGVDSTAVLCAARAAAGPVKAFTVGFDRGDYDESARAAAAARAAGAEHYVLPVGPGDLAAAFAASVWHGETPVVNAHSTAKFLLSKLAGTHVKVVLTGEGADELLAGYPQFAHQHLLDYCRRHPGDREAAAALDRMARASTLFSGTVPIRAHPEYDRVAERFGAYPYGLVKPFVYQRPMRHLLARRFRRATAGVDTLQALEAALGPRPFEGLDAISASQAYQFRTELPGYILVNLGDREEMAHGVEGRVPFLDHELVELVCSLPLAVRASVGPSKQLLRSALARIAPDLATYEKQIFLAPSMRVLGLEAGRSPLDEWLDARHARDAGVFSPLAVAGMRTLARRARPGTRLQAIGEAFTVAALSIHLLDDMFCRNFAASRRAYAPGPPAFDLERGRVELPDVLGT